MPRLLDIAGFVDLQINGYAGVDFSSADLTAEQIDHGISEIMRCGTAGFLATVITSPMVVYRHVLPLLADAAQRHAALLGVHLEGPFLLPQSGASGAHNASLMQNADISVFDELLDLAQDHVRLVTLAADLPDSDALTRHCRNRGVAVSLGHHDATPDDLARHAAAGAMGLTHLGNGVSNLVHRHNNPILAGLACDDLSALIITDGHHLPDHMIRIINRVKTPARLIVTSDAAPIAGLPPGRYNTLGNDVILEPDGRLHNPVEDHLVGSSACMLDCMNHLASLNIMHLPELLRVGYSNPLEMIGMDGQELPAIGRLYVDDNGNGQLRFHFDPIQQPI